MGYSRLASSHIKLSLTQHDNIRNPPPQTSLANHLSCHAFKLGISSEQDAKPAAWLR